MYGIFSKRRRGVLACCSALAASSGAPLNDAQIYINNVPPFSYMDEGRNAGLVYELLDQMAARARVRSRISSVPFKRVEEKLKQQPSSLAAIWRQPEVEWSYTWIVKLLEEPVMLVARSDTIDDISLIDSARKLRVGVVLGSPAELIARRLGFERIDVANSAASNALKLQFGRIDAWLAVPSVIAAAQQHIGSDIRVLRYGPPIEKIAIYLSCAKPCIDIDIGQWKKAAANMKMDGSYAGIVGKYSRIRQQVPEFEVPLR